MTILSNIHHRFVNYWSPRKTQQRRDKEFKVPALPVRPSTHDKQLATPEARSVSPGSRVRSWKVTSPVPYSDPMLDIDETLLPPSPPASAKHYDDDDVASVELAASPSIHQPGSSDDEWDANEGTMVMDDDKYMTSTIDVAKEQEKHVQQARELRAADWPEDAIFLFQKLGMRGLEPLLPRDWLDDLETLPGDLFTIRSEKVFLKPAHGSACNAQTALSNLFDLGGRVRDARMTKAKPRTPEYQIRRAVKKYTTWAMKDGEVSEHWTSLPLFKTVTWQKDVYATIGEKEALSQLGALHAKWEAALSEAKGQNGENTVPEVPTLYGVTASHTIMAFVRYTPPTASNPVPILGLIAMFDFSKEGHEVWHALAIAILVIHCRNRMMQLQEYLPRPKQSVAKDPDA